jgi:hypothetical protein
VGGRNRKEPGRERPERTGAPLDLQLSASQLSSDREARGARPHPQVRALFSSTHTYLGARGSRRCHWHNKWPSGPCLSENEPRHLRARVGSGSPKRDGDPRQAHEGVRRARVTRCQQTHSNALKRPHTRSTSEAPKLLTHLHLHLRLRLLARKASKKGSLARVALFCASDGAAPVIGCLRNPCRASS